MDNGNMDKGNMAETENETKPETIPDDEEQALEEKRLKRRRAQKVTFRVLIVLTVIVAAYIIYALVTKEVNIFIFQILLGVFIVGYMVLSDIVEPKLSGDFEDLDDYRKMGFIKMLVMDVIGTAALLYWIVGIGTEDGADFLIPALIYIVCLNMKRRFREEFEGVKKAAEEEPEEEESEGEEKSEASEEEAALPGPEVDGGVEEPSEEPKSVEAGSDSESENEDDRDE